MNKIAVFDIDNVLADFEGRLVNDVLMVLYGYDTATKNRDKYKFAERWGYAPDVLDRALDFVNDPNSYYGLKPIPAMVEFAQACENQGAVLYVSSRPEDGYTLRFTIRWLKKNGLLSNPDIHHVFCGVGDKFAFLKYLADREEGHSIDFIVEDSPETIKALKNDFTVVTFDRQWNKGIYPRIRDNNGVLMYQEVRGEREESLYDAFS